MKKYLPFWLILVSAFAVIFFLSAIDDAAIGQYKPKSAGIYETIFRNRDFAKNSLLPDTVAESPKKEEVKTVPVDTTSKTILFIGDSMLEGLSPRLAAYAIENGHKLYSVMWYSSTSERWGTSGKLASYIARIKPDYIFICLGSNELFVNDIIRKRDGYVKKIINEIGSIPYVWIGPPNWKPDTGINALIASNVKDGSYFKSDGMTFERSKDGAHPTRKSASQWMDSVARWMPMHSSHPIRLKTPASASAKPMRLFVHQPDEK